MLVERGRVHVTGAGGPSDTSILRALVGCGPLLFASTAPADLAELRRLEIAWEKADRIGAWET